MPQPTDPPKIGRIRQLDGTLWARGEPWPNPAGGKQWPVTVMAIFDYDEDSFIVFGSPAEKDSLWAKNAHSAVAYISKNKDVQPVECFMPDAQIAAWAIELHKDAVEEWNAPDEPDESEPAKIGGAP